MVRNTPYVYFFFQKYMQYYVQKSWNELQDKEKMNFCWRIMLKSSDRLVWQLSVVRGEKRASSIAGILRQDIGSGQWRSSQSCRTPWPSGYTSSGSTSIQFSRMQGKEHNSEVLVQRCEVEVKRHTDTSHLTESKRQMQVDDPFLVWAITPCKW